MKKVMCIIFAIIIPIFAFTGCKDDSVTYQNQFLNVFGIDFVSTKHQKVEADKLKDYIYIELNETEKSKMDEKAASSGLLYSIAENNGDYIFLNEILKNDFSQDIKNVENGYFSVYNKISEKIIDFSSDDFQNIDMDFFTAIIYDSQNGIIYLFNYSRS
ncbi:MAG: hypothetical protein ACI4IG_03445 [Eubacterium sp.]